MDIAVHPTFAYSRTASSTKSYTQLLNPMNDGVSGQQGVGGANPWVVLPFSTWCWFNPGPHCCPQLIQTPSIRSPCHKSSVQFVHNNNPTRHRAAWPSQMSQPLGRLHQITVVCPSNDPNRIPLLQSEDLGRDSIVGGDLQAGNPLSTTLSPSLFHPGGSPKINIPSALLCH